MVVAENVIFITAEQEMKNCWTHFVRTKAVLVGCDAVSPGATHPVTQSHTDHSTTVLLLTDH